MTDPHTCLGCGRDTTARGEVCRACYTPDADEECIGGDDRDQYERDADAATGFGDEWRTDEHL